MGRDDIDIQELRKAANLPEDQFRLTVLVNLRDVQQSVQDAKRCVQAAVDGTDRIERAIRDHVGPTIKVHAERLWWHRAIGAFIISLNLSWLAWLTVKVLKS